MSGPLVDFCENHGVYSVTLGLDRDKGVGFQSFALHKLIKGILLYLTSLCKVAELFRRWDLLLDNIPQGENLVDFF